MSDATIQPIIGVPADFKEMEGKPFHAVGDKYVRALALACQVNPFILPAFGELYDLPGLVHQLDGLLLTGGLSNVHPEHYGESHAEVYEPYDRERDETTLPLIREPLAQGVPLLAICRGMQELNVALGGSLHPAVHELPDRLDHRAPEHDDPDVKYGPNHSTTLTPGGAIAAIAGREELTVNSLHRQAVERLATGLSVEAQAPDGTIEAVRVTDAKAFALGVQWHPEYKVLENSFSTKLFVAFGEAARVRARTRASGGLAAPASRTSRPVEVQIA